ncbi:hypothetical protein U0070_011197 [Myodes glareolus]|uniref:Uncharacterized protein n=1 Tax=Myodes glareolus TaxID=447135 RepID=A0AAW0HFI0_MYOGA
MLGHSYHSSVRPVSTVQPPLTPTKRHSLCSPVQRGQGRNSCGQGPGMFCPESQPLETSQVPKETVRLDLLLEDSSQNREDPLADYHDDVCQVPKNIPPKNK